MSGALMDCVPYSFSLEDPRAWDGTWDEDEDECRDDDGKTDDQDVGAGPNLSHM